MEFYIDILISWMPMIILIIVWIFFMKKTGSMNYKKYSEECLAETKITNKNLEKIIALLENNGKQ